MTVYREKPGRSHSGSGRIRVINDARSVPIKAMPFHANQELNIYMYREKRCETRGLLYIYIDMICKYLKITKRRKSTDLKKKKV